jgi:RNA polymerase sigma-70 factor (ECF subfamily)
LDSSELLDRLRRGDDAAFDEIFRTWYAPLVRLAERFVGTQAVAEELVQDVMLEMWRRRELLAEEGSPQAYLYRSTRNRALNHLRHARVEQRAAPKLADPGSREAPAPAQVVAQELDSAVRSAIDGLPDRCRQVFQLSRVHGLKYSEIATTLGISVKTVEAQMGRALRELRERLAEWLPEGTRS